ncbi:MAG TPA: antibiotic biosynthesis monooxygenase [Acidimicrobiales bacterium]|nr:antibiotic biosynthesis monooxygenase [Acidimicrobiales bacterium]
MTVLAVTTVRVDPGSIDALAELFAETNPALVAEHDDWLGAWFSADREDGEICVIARWRSAASYEQLRASEAYHTTMQQFAASFLAPPEVRLYEVAVEM